MKLTKEQADEIEKEMRRLENDSTVTKTKLINMPDIIELIKKYYTEEEIKAIEKKVLACGCSICTFNALVNEFGDRTTEEDAGVAYYGA